MTTPEWQSAGSKSVIRYCGAIRPYRTMARVLVVLMGVHACFNASGRAAAAPDVSPTQITYLRGLTAAVLAKAKLAPGEKNAQGRPNTSGGTLIKPGGNYQWFWIRDYAMSLDTGLITDAEQRHLLRYTAAAQADVETTVLTGSRIPVGSIPDRIAVSGEPAFFPGPSAPDKRGGLFGRVPPFDDQYYFIHMAWHLICKSGQTDVATWEVNGQPLLTRLERAFAAPPHPADFESIFCDENNFGISFGFYDTVPQTGFLLFATVLKYQAARQLAEIFTAAGHPEKASAYTRIAARIRIELPLIFATPRGLPRSSTGRNALPDVWGTAYGISIGALEGEPARHAAQVLADAYEAGTLAHHGYIRHALTTDDTSDACIWELMAKEFPKGRYQNGGYWATPVGWVCEAINLVRPDLARRLAGEFIAELEKTDFRKDPKLGGPYECLQIGADPQNPVYLASVSGPLVSFEKLRWGIGGLTTTQP